MAISYHVDGAVGSDRYAAAVRLPRRLRQGSDRTTTDEADPVSSSAGAEPPTPAPVEVRTAPSFAAKLEEAKRSAARLRTEHGLREPVFEVNAKPEGRAFAESLGIRVPGLLAGPVLLDELALGELPDRFVLKPIEGASSRGVFLLHRIGLDRYVSLLDDREELDEAAVRARIAPLVEAGRIAAEMIVEELVHDGPPEAPRPPADWRFFCFYGEVGFVMARSVGFKRRAADMGFRFFGPDWSCLGPLRSDVRHDPDLEPPRHAEELLAVAARLSAAIPRPMVRIDLFDGADGSVFNEITPLPGGQLTFSGGYDERFGALWEAAETRLTAELIRSGSLALRV
jgi:hypothetical protein